MTLGHVLARLALWRCLSWFLGISALAERRMVRFVPGPPMPVFWRLGAALPARLNRRA